MYSAQTKRPIFKIICVGLSFVFIFSHILLPKEALAGRSKAGGGDLAEFDFSKLAISAGISLGSMAIGGAITRGLQSAYGQVGGIADQSMNLWDIAAAIDAETVLKVPTPGILASMGDSLAKSFNVSNFVTGYSTFVATSQVGRAVGMMGNYYGWSPSSTFIVSNVASGLTGGFLNPSITLGDAIPASLSLATEPVRLAYYTSLSTMAKGALVGGLTGLASSGALVAIGGDRINERKEPGIGAQIAGLVAGVAIGNFTRALVNPATWNETSLGAIRQEKNPEIKIYQDSAKEQMDIAADLEPKVDVGLNALFDPAALDYMDAIVKGGSYAQMAQQIQKDKPNIIVKATGGGPGKIEWTTILEEDVLKGPNIVLRPIGNTGVFKVVQTNAQIDALGIGTRLLEATFIKTADMWPRLASRALSITATHLLGNDNRELATLVSSAVEGLATPFLLSLAEYNALRPGLYIGENRIANSIEYINNIGQAIIKWEEGEIGARLSEASARIKDPNKLKDEFQKILDDSKIGVKLPDLLDRNKLLEDRRNELVRAGLTTEEINKDLTKYATTLPKNLNSPNTMLGIAMGRVLLERQVNIKDLIYKEGKTLDEVLTTLRTDRLSLFWNSATREMKFGLFEGAVSGGVSYLTSQLSKDDPLAGAAGAYAVSMLTGAIRGIIWYETWEPARQEINGGDGLVWMPKYSLFKPEPYKGDDWFQQKVSEYTYPRELERFNKFGGRFFGEEPRLRTRTEVQIGPLGEIEGKNVEIPGYELVFKDQKPDLSIAVLVSLAQTNREFLNRTFAFGAPQTSPENINTFMMSDYLRQLNSYAVSGSRPGWFSSGLTSGLLSAGSSSISNNLLTSLAANKSMADALGMQRQRLVLTNSPLMGANIQSLDYKPWAVGLETRFYLSFPSDIYRARSRTGKSFIKE